MRLLAPIATPIPILIGSKFSNMRSTPVLLRYGYFTSICLRLNCFDAGTVLARSPGSVFDPSRYHSRFPTCRPTTEHSLSFPVPPFDPLSGYSLSPYKHHDRLPATPDQTRFYNPKAEPS